MLSPAILSVADRLAAILMVLVDAISPIALGASTPTFADHAAKTLFFRLVTLVTTLIRISNFGLRVPAKPATTPKTSTHLASIAQRPVPSQRFPSHPGWLLAALPDIAPAVATDLAALLADPALAALFAATPTLHRTLRPLLRGLGLGQPPGASPPPSSNPPPRAHPIRRGGAPNPPTQPTNPTADARFESSQSAQRLSTS